MSRPFDRLLSMAEVAAYTGRSTRTVRRWIREGRLQPARLGRAVWIPESALLGALGMPLEPDTGAEADGENNLS